MVLHFHTDGEICPSSFGLICPLGDEYDQPAPGTLPPGIIPKMPNGMSLQSMFAGGGGMGAFNGMGFNPAMAMAAMGGGMDGDAGDMNLMMATMLSAMSAGGSDPLGDSFDMSSLAAGLDGGSASFIQSMAMTNPAMAMAMAAASGGGGGGPSAAFGGNPMAMMAAMAAASQGGAAGGNPAMAMMAAMAAAQGGAGGGGMFGGTDSSGKPVPPAVVAARVKAVMAQAQTNMQISQTVANSSLAKLTDVETRIMSEGKFYTTKEFVNFMQSSTTEVGMLSTTPETPLLMSSLV